MTYLKDRLAESLEYDDVTGLYGMSTARIAQLNLAQTTYEGDLIAASSQLQGGCPLTADKSVITTVATTSDSATLPVPGPLGRVILIVNAGANQAKLFPPVGCDIGSGTDASANMNASTSREYIATSSTRWRVLS